MLFKPTLNAKLEEVRKYLPVSTATSFQNISPFIQAAEVNYILPLLGQKFLDQVTAYYDSPAPLPEGITEESAALFKGLIERIQRALINLTYWSAFDFMNVLMNDSGFHRQESDTEKTLYKYQEESLKAGFKNNGFDALDTVLEFIESHIEAFPLFLESENYTERKTSIIPNTTAFTKIFNINNSRLVYLKISRFITQVEDFDIQAVLGAALYARVKAELAKPVPDPKVAALIPYLQKPLAHLSIAKASFQLGINVNDKGLFFESQDSTQQNSAKTTPLTDNQYYALAQTSQNVGLAYLDLLAGFLAAHASDYPEYKLPGRSPLVRDNRGKTAYWV